MHRSTHTSRTRTLKTSLAITAVCGALALSSCASPATDAAAPAALNIGFPVPLETLDLNTNSTVFNYYAAALVQEGLVGIDELGTVQPAIAEKWEQRDDTTYVYTIRDDAKFSDGTELTVEDVLFSFEFSADETLSPNTAWGFANVASVEQTGDREVTVQLAQPDASFQWTVSNAGALLITSESYYNEHADTWGTADGVPLGTGPYQVTEFVPDSHVSYAATDTWWGGDVATEEVRIDFLPDANTRLLAMQSNEIDAALNVPIDQLSAWEAIDGVSIIDAPDQSYVGLAFKQNIAPFDDIHVREAIGHALDADTIVAEVLQGKGQVATGLTSPELLTGTYSPEEAQELVESVPRPEFNMDLAAEALAKSSVPDGFEFEVVTQNSNPQIADAMNLLAGNLAEIGVTMTVVSNEQWGAAIRDDVHGVAVLYSFAVTSDPGERTNFLLAETNLFGYQNAAVTDLVAEQLTESDPKKRIEMILEANREQAADPVHLPVWWGQMSVAVDGDLAGTDLNAFTLLSPWADQFTAE